MEVSSVGWGILLYKYRKDTKPLYHAFMYSLITKINVTKSICAQRVRLPILVGADSRIEINWDVCLFIKIVLKISNTC